MTTLLILKQSVDSWLLRDDVGVSNSEFSTILLLAEAEIAVDVRCVVAHRLSLGFELPIAVEIP